MSMFWGLLVANAMREESQAVNYYSFMTEVNDQYYTDHIPSVGDENIIIYDSDLNIVATNGVCSSFYLSYTKTTYLSVTNSSLWLTRWSGLTDIINIPEPSIYFDGSHYVDTGYKPTADSRAEIGFTAETPDGEYGYLFGSRYSDGSLTTYTCKLDGATGKLIGNYSDTTAFDVTSYSVVGCPIDISFTGSATVVSDASTPHTVNDLSVNDNGHTNHNIYIGALDQNNAVLSGTGFKGHIRYFRIYEGDSLDYDLEVVDGRFHDTVDGLYYDLQSM